MHHGKKFHYLKIFSKNIINFSNPLFVSFGDKSSGSL